MSQMCCGHSVQTTPGNPPWNLPAPGDNFKPSFKSPQKLAAGRMGTAHSTKGLEEGQT